jgi:hypothetical protein
MASTSESRSGASRILTDMQLSVYWMIVQKVIVVYQPVAKERKKLFLSHTHNRKVICSGTRI